MTLGLTDHDNGVKLKNLEMENVINRKLVNPDATESKIDIIG